MPAATAQYGSGASDAAAAPRFQCQLDLEEEEEEEEEWKCRVVYCQTRISAKKSFYKPCIFRRRSRSRPLFIRQYSHARPHWICDNKSFSQDVISTEMLLVVVPAEWSHFALSDRFPSPICNRWCRLLLHQADLSQDGKRFFTDRSGDQSVTTLPAAAAAAHGKWKCLLCRRRKLVAHLPPPLHTNLQSKLFAKKFAV